ncbi:hypothetical protein MJH12_16795 [bacterium]|nr:hypothetical protein [bacterium]
MKKVIAILLGLVIFASGIFYISYESIILEQINQSLRDSFTTEAHLSALKLDIFDSSILINDLIIENPKGFTNKNFIELKSLELKMPLFEQSKSRIVVNSLDLSGLSIELAFEQSEINGNILKKKPAVKDSQTMYPELLIQNLKITGLKLSVNFKGKISHLDVPDLILKDLLIHKDPAPPLNNAIRQILQKVKAHCKKAYLEKYRSKLHQIIEDKTKEKLDQIKEKIGNKFKKFLKF